MKLVWYLNNSLGRPKKKKIVSRQRAYYGVTVAAASLTGLPTKTMQISTSLSLASIIDRPATDLRSLLLHPAAQRHLGTEWRVTVARRQNHDRRADLYPSVKVDDVLVSEADTTR